MNIELKAQLLEIAQINGFTASEYVRFVTTIDQEIDHFARSTHYDRTGESLEDSYGYDINGNSVKED